MNPSQPSQNFKSSPDCEPSASPDALLFAAMDEIQARLIEHGTVDVTGNADDSRSKTIGECAILRELGRGGMGVVYEGVQEELDRHVALTILPLAALASDQRLRRFKNEARAAATLHHENIVPIYSVGTDHGINYYAMQFIDGPSLAEVVRDLRESKEAGRVENSPELGASTSVTTQRRWSQSEHSTDTRRDIQMMISTERDTARRRLVRVIRIRLHAALVWQR